MNVIRTWALIVSLYIMKRTFPWLVTVEIMFEVRFAESLDRGMLERVLQVRNASGEVVPGVIAIDELETLWKLTPDHAWTPGEYSLDVDTGLEDLAGNSLAKPFEVDLFETIKRKIVRKTESVSFTVLSKK